MSIPRLETIDEHPRLVVDGRPFLVLGGELHNSSSSSRYAIRTSFATLRDRNFNTVLAPVSWATVEPTEGTYDFGLVDELLAVARTAQLRLVPLWFGAWKNGMSTYVPAWVRTDPARYPRAEPEAGAHSEHVSPFGAAIGQADARAFAALMRHLRTVDAGHQTVVMVQVENEVGLLGGSRDHSPDATAAFEADVPPGVYEALAAYPDLRIAASWKERGCPRQGTWTTVFGDSATTDEAFMAAAYASHVEVVAAAGKAEYPLPMFVNAWLDAEIDASEHVPAGGQRPGVYPSGGPLPHVAGLWRRFAPSLDLLTPDIYFGSFEEICRDYRAAAGGLFIPEMRRDEQGAADVFLAVGNHGAIGTSPFGVDSVEGTEAEALRDAYGLLDSVAPLLASHPTAGVHLDEARPEVEVHLGAFVFSARRESTAGSP
ncbi:GH35 family beta-galactosidase [Cryptosporangium minutisporangium]|uniref:Glycoside hydrolase 35 catalytic domain-containing protein n=1 Tax=Cryptosporangium minutisporangium TaxID=113569 RepID=A0ABP6SS01_9ACTN